MHCPMLSALRVENGQTIQNTAETTTPNEQVTNPITAIRLLSLGITRATIPSISPMIDTDEPMANVGIVINSGIPMNNMSKAIRDVIPRFNTIILIFITLSVSFILCLYSKVVTFITEAGEKCQVSLKIQAGVWFYLKSLPIRINKGRIFPIRSTLITEYRV
jgi:hypothetical protein